MNPRKCYELWIEQCDAAVAIQQRHGSEAAFDYLVAGKLSHFVDAAADYPEFARELPRFVERVRSMFTAAELRTHVARVEREIADDDDGAEERAGRLSTVKALLTGARRAASGAPTLQSPPAAELGRQRRRRAD